MKTSKLRQLLSSIAAIPGDEEFVNMTAALAKNLATQGGMKGNNESCTNNVECSNNNVCSNNGICSGNSNCGG
jgi:hypothetical protein